MDDFAASDNPAGGGADDKQTSILPSLGTDCGFE